MKVGVRQRYDTGTGKSCRSCKLVLDVGEICIRTTDDWGEGLYAYHVACVQKIVDKAIKKQEAKGQAGKVPETRKERIKKEFQDLRERIIRTGDPYT